MTWFAVFETLTGRLHSIGEVLADPLPVDLSTLVLAGQPDASQMWDQDTRQFIARPPKVLVDRLQDILTNPNYSEFQTVWNGLNTARKTQLRNAMILLLGPARFRNPTETVEING